MARFCSLSSSSKGNCSYVAGGNSALLVDVGISFKQVKLQLEKRDIALSDINGIVITHEHSDHIKGLGVLLKHFDIPLYSAPETLEYLQQGGHVPPHARLIPVKKQFLVGDIAVTPFDTPHDAVHSMGFRMEMPDESVISVATDLGSITLTVREHLEGSDLILLESNFDHGMLDCSQYPYPIKCRIRGERGHLANEDCASEIAHLVRTGTSRFVLGHLSEQNNVPILAYETTRMVLGELDMVEGSDYLLEVAPAREASNMVVL